MYRLFEMYDSYHMLALPITSLSIFIIFKKNVSAPQATGLGVALGHSFSSGMDVEKVDTGGASWPQIVIFVQLFELSSSRDIAWPSSR